MSYVDKTAAQRRPCQSGLDGWTAARKPILQQEQEQKGLVQDWWKSVLWSDEFKFEIFGSNCCVFVRHMFAAHSETCRWRCDGVGVDDLFKIQGTLDQQFNCSILQQHLNWFVLSGTTICFSTRRWPQKDFQVIWRLFDPKKRRVMECCNRWPGLHSQSPWDRPRPAGLAWLWVHIFKGSSSRVLGSWAWFALCLRHERTPKEETLTLYST